MEQLLNFLNENPWLNLIFLALAIVSIFISLFLYFLSKKEKSPSFNIKHFNLVKGHIRKLDRVKITYDDEEVEDLTLTRVSFWNQGRETIDKSDIAQADPIRIQLPEGAILLESSLDYVHNPVNNISIHLSEDRRCLYISFDYLYISEGCTLTLYHTADSNEVRFLGTIKGSDRIKKGVVEKDDLMKAYADLLIKTVGGKDKLNWFRKSILGFIVLLSIPILMVLTALETILRLLKRSPSHFTLQDAE